MDLTQGEKEALALAIQRLEFPDVMHIVTLINGGRDPATLPEEELEIDIAKLPPETLAAVHAYVNRPREPEEEEDAPVAAPRITSPKKKRQSILPFKSRAEPAPPVRGSKAKKGKRQATLTSGLTLSSTPPPGLQAKYTCETCGKSFKRTHLLAEHRVSHNKGADGNPFRCQTCGITVSNSANLKRHMRKHTGERPFLCMHCGRSFTQSGNCKEHEFRCGGATTRIKRAGDTVPTTDMLVTTPPKGRKRSRSVAATTAGARDDDDD